MTKPVILTGLRANNDLHIGNYFGGLLPLIDMARSHSDQYEINLFIPDLHSFTTPIDHTKLQKQILHNMKLFAAAGLPLDNDNVHIYRQSYVPAHSELTWILDCFTSFGEMNRMTQFKDKSLQQRVLTENQLAEFIVAKAEAEGMKVFREYVLGNGRMADMVIEAPDGTQQIIEFKSTEAIDPSVGLFNYPVLMAADILLYGATYVPVGDDQTQHLEFTRDIAERMNSKFGELFAVPESVKKQHEFFGKDQGLRIKDLADPSRKMSKSADSDKGVIFLGDEPSAAAKKIKSATTDSFTDGIKYNPDERTGISNLLQISALLQNKSVADVEKEYEGVSSYGNFKGRVAEQVEAFLQDFQARFDQVSDSELLAKLQADEKLMNQKANETLLRVQKAVGLR